VILAIFVLSGAAGLVYEVVWARQLVLVFGNTTQAVSAILTGFFGGMAIGAVVGGRVADRVRSPLRLYGFLELILVVVVLLTPVLFRALHEVYRGFYGSLQDQPVALGFIRLGLALLALAPATIFMGATLPTLSRHLTRGRAANLDREFGRLYTANTLGAIFGTSISGFVLIELLGLSLTLAVGAACSLTAGLAALWLSRRQRAPEDMALGVGPAATAASPAPSPDPASVAPASAVGRPTAAAAEPTIVETIALEPLPAIAERAIPSADEVVTRPSDPAPGRSIALAVAFVSGLTSLGYQVLWTRLLASGSGNTTYIFTTILLIFLVGIAGGAALYTAGLGRGRSRVLALGVTQVLVSLIALFGLTVISGFLIKAPLTLTILYAVLPATLLMGLSLPIASGLAAQRDAKVASDTGLLLAVNTAGTVFGTFVVPFVLIPAIGSPRSVLVLATLNALLGIALLYQHHVATEGRLAQARRVALASSRIVAIGVAAAVIGSLIVRPDYVRDPNDLRVTSAGTLFASAEDEIASVQSGMEGGQKHLWVGGTAMTLLTIDAKLMPLLPLMARPNSTNILTIAFGMGSAYRESLIAGLHVQGVELVPSVPEMFGYYYPDAASVLSNPNGQLAITDGRNYVELSDKTFDIIVVDPPPPIESSGTAVLYSQEFYQASSRRLNPGGVMMEWMPYGQNLDEFKAHLRTFASVFPQVAVYFGPGGYGTYLLGSTQPITLDPANIKSVLSRPGVAADLTNTPDGGGRSLQQWIALIPTLFWVSGDRIHRFTGDGPLITDDRPLTEYFLLRRLYGPSYPPSYQLRAFTPP
jgi:spermidine synthase